MSTSQDLVSPSFHPCCSLDTQHEVTDIHKMLAISMSSLESTAGIALVTGQGICLLRHGSFAGRPFGIHSRRCCTQATFRTVTVMTLPFRTTTLEWKCNIHGNSTQHFGASLHSWCPVGESGHIARWSIFIPPPPLFP